MVEVPVFTFFFEIWRVIEWNQMALHYYSMQFFFLFICQEPITWPANNCQQKIICSCAMSLNCVWLKIIFCSCGNEIKPRFSPFCDRSCVKMKASRRYSWKSKLGDRMIKQLLNSVIAKYYDLPVFRSSIICLILRSRQITDLLTTDKSRYFAQLVQ